MSNKDNYKKAIDQIHAPEYLKQKTLEKMVKKKSKITYLKILSTVAIFFLIFTLGFEYLKKDKNTDNDLEISTIEKLNPELPRFKDMKELTTILENSNAILSDSRDGYLKTAVSLDEEEQTTVKAQTENSNSDFSKTNNQVKNVDEADIVKTDGKNIFFISNGNVNIVNAEKLELQSKIEGYYNNKDEESFSPNNIFINNGKLIVIGNYNKYETQIDSNNRENNKLSNTLENIEDDIYYDEVKTRNNSFTKAIIYDLSDIRNPKILREVALEGYYKDARMIKDNIYFISSKNIDYYYDKDEDAILPTVLDSIAQIAEKKINCTEIAYFPNSSYYSFLLVGGFNINNNEPVKVETLFGASDIIYCSEKNLYLTDNLYDRSYGKEKVSIYKFELDDSNIVLKAKGEVDGHLNDQFSMDEYNGNLRIATTINRNSFISSWMFGEFKQDDTENVLYILDEKLEEIGKIDKIAIGEKIYAVRFIGNIGYVVTFEQIDPLFVIDLSNPKKPEVKGKLEIPGYSSYLHPYDDTHIIGIGYNTKDNGYGGIENSSMKMSMFDVSDLDNPKEMFNVDIGENKYTYSDLMNNHKALFYKASDNLIGIPYITDSKNNRTMSNFEIFHIDLEKGFEKHCNFIHEYDNRTNIKRMIYIEDIVYGLAENKIISYDLNTKEILNELELDEISHDELNIDY